MSLVCDLTCSFYGGAGVISGGAGSTIVTRFPVAFGGHPYEVDGKLNQFRHESIPMLRQQADQSSSPAEASLNPDDLWRRAADSWHRGAGQEVRDRPDSDPNRFRASKGISPWERYQISLLPGTDQKLSASTQIVVAGTRLYSINGTTLEYTTDITVDTPTFTPVTGGSPAPFTSITSNGFTVYATDGTDVWSTNTGISTKSVYNTLNATRLGYVKGRLMATSGPSIYNITSGTPPSALFTHPNADFLWVGFASAETAILAAGFSGDKSLIYRITIKDDATALDAPVVVGELPDGEVVRSIGGYLGFIVIGTDKGWRFAQLGTSGDLTIGALVRTPNPVLCFEGQDRFIWFGYTNYDGVSTGLGRMDTTQVNDNLAPAWASDLMATAQASVTSIATFQNRTVFCATAMYAQDTSIVAGGTLETGFTGFGLPDTKIGLLFDVRTDPLDGSYSVAISEDTGPYHTIGTQTLAATRGAQFPMGQVQAERFEAKLTLARSIASPTLGPSIIRWTMKVAPAVELREYIVVPLLLHDVVTVHGTPYKMNVPAERDYIKGLRSSQQLTVYQEGTDIAYSGQVVDYSWMPFELSPRGTHFQGTMVVKFRRVL